MGRRKLEIKRIEEKSARQVTFSKRRNGLMKKAKELSVLCDLDVGVIVYSARGKLYHYCSNNSLTEILQRYQNTLENDSSPSSGECEAHGQYSKYSRFLTCKELLQVVESDANEACPDEPSVNDLVHLEQQIETALTQTRMAKTHLLLDSISSLHEKEKMLEEEKRLLETEIGGSCKRNKMAIDLNVAPHE